MRDYRVHVFRNIIVKSFPLETFFRSSRPRVVVVSISECRNEVPYVTQARKCAIITFAKTSAVVMQYNFQF